MSKFCGNIGFVDTIELLDDETGNTTGIWEEQVTERMYYGDVLRSNRRLISGDKINDDFDISNQISVVMDPYAENHIFSMRYVEFMGAKWKVNNADIQRPRIILTLGGLYNENSE